MVNTEPVILYDTEIYYYNILNIVVNTELGGNLMLVGIHYNILNIVVNTERSISIFFSSINYNILNIVVNTEPSNLP